MKELVVLSGKGGTGKTSIVASFAVLAKDKVLVDCDVDAADLNLILQPSLCEEHEFWSGQVAVIDNDKCTECGLCLEMCHFQAISDYRVNPVSCEGCGFCSHICPAKAITMQETMAGHWFISDTGYGTLVHARLGIAQENSGKLVAAVREKARDVAREQDVDRIISDGPPGIGCPVISSLSGATLALLVTEPTLSGIHDLERVLDVCRHFHVPAIVCINKFDINDDNTQRIEDYCRDEGVKVAARIPFDNAFMEAMVSGLPVVEYSRNGISNQIESLWTEVSEALDK